ncbi:30922_t:CDS:2, partial [Racocetra persica]
EEKQKLVKNCPNCKAIFIPNQGANCSITCSARKLENEHKKAAKKMIAYCFPKKKKEFFETNPHEAGHITAFEKKFISREREVIKKMYDLRDKYEASLIEEYELLNYYEEHQKVIDKYQE